MNISAHTLLSVSNLRTYFFMNKGTIHAVDGVSFYIDEGEAVGLVGESGCGKTITARSIMRLIPSPPARIVDGEILFDGKDIVTLDESEAREILGGEISMIFQDPMTFLNPIMSVGEQVSEVIRFHQKLKGQELHQAVISALDRARVPDPNNIIHSYPHELSGGMRQRVLIAMAVSCSPKLIIADEPTTALDVTVQAQIIRLIENIIKEMNTSILIITHDLGIVAGICDRVYVMYAGQIIEEASVSELYDSPLHPYTQGLLGCVTSAAKRVTEFTSIEGTVPNLMDPPSGCRFHPRCSHVMPICIEKSPQYLRQEGLKVACWLYDPSVEVNRDESQLPC